MAALQQPSLNYNTSPTRLAPTVNLTGNLPSYFDASAGTSFYKLTSLGFSSYQLFSIMIDKFGKEASFAFPAMETLIARMKSVPQSVGYRRRGREIQPSGLVLSTVTSNGTGLSQIVIKVTLEGGAGISGNGYWTKGQVIVGASNGGRRQFSISATTIAADGSQQITVIPLDGKANLVVAGSQSSDFPTGLTFGSMGVSVLAPEENQVFNNLIIQPDTFASYRLTRKYMEFKRDRITMQNDLTSGGVATDYLETGDGSKIGVFVTYQELQEVARVMEAFYISLFYGEPNNNPDLTSQLGAGFVQMIPPDLQRIYSPSELGYDYLSNILRQYSINHPAAAGKTIDLVCGQFAFEQIQRSLTDNNKIQFRTEPFRQVSDLQSGFTAGPTRYGSFLSIQDINLRISSVTAFNKKQITSARSPMDPNVSISSHDMILMDLENPIQNRNPVTGSYEPEGEYCANFYCPQNPDGTPDCYQDVYFNGMIDETGNAIKSGPVVSLNQTTTHRVEVAGGLELAQPDSAMWFRIA